jgi:hypothetical protein
VFVDGHRLEGIERGIQEIVERSGIRPRLVPDI